MLKNYLKIALRNLLKYKATSFINIFGLSIGVACCVLISLYVLDELSYDRYHEKADQIHRVKLYASLGTAEMNTPFCAMQLAAAMKNEIPEVIEAVRIRSFGFPVVRYNDKVFSEEKFYWTDPSIFDVFTIPFIHGNPETALVKPGSVVITETMAKKYFGDQNPMGKTIQTDRKIDYMVTGVVKDVPRNSHFHFDFLGTLSTYEKDMRHLHWLANTIYTYVVLREGVSPGVVDKKLAQLVRKHVWPIFEQVTGAPAARHAASGDVYQYSLQPLTSIHLHSHLEKEFEANGDMLYVYIFSLIASAILVIACINFMNLATARSTRRAKEVGVRKTLGCGQAQLVRQFLVESMLLSFVAIIAGLILVEFHLPIFNRLTGKALAPVYMDSVLFLPMLIGLVIVVGFLAGLYPAFFLASYQPDAVLKGAYRKGGKNARLRSGLVIVQFTVSVILIIGGFVVYSQLEFIRSRDLGFNKDHLLVIRKTDDIGTVIPAFKQELLKLPDVSAVSNSTIVPGDVKEIGSTPFRLAGQEDGVPHLFRIIGSDDSFAETYQMEMKAGRFFSLGSTPHNASAVLNETAVKQLGLEDPLGRVLTPPANLDGHDGEPAPRLPIIGVIKDFHFESLHQPIRPLVIRQLNKKWIGKFVTVRLRPGDPRKTLRRIEKIWHRFALNQAFEYEFMDSDFNRVYEADERTGGLITVFSILAVFVACLGLLGLAAFTTEQRVKEIAVRKALGASVGGLVSLLSRKFLRWVLIANIIAWPAAYFIMRRWLWNFAYRVDIEPWMFLFSALLVMMIAFLTLSYQVFKAARANPVNALKHE